MGAAIVWHAERARVGDAAAADVIGGFDQHELAAGGCDLARRRDPGGAGADDDNVIDGSPGRDGASRGACRKRG